MSNFGPLPGQPAARVPLPPRGEPIARYDTYLEAQRAVDYLSDHHFPVQFVTIVGTGLQMVERVTGRLTYPRVALAGALSGAWFGLFVGLVLSLFGGTDAALLAAPLFGAAFGILFGVISYALTGGRRDFTSTSQIVASEYAVLCLAEQAGAARHLLQQLPGGTGRGARSGEPPAGPGVDGTGHTGIPYGPGSGTPGWPVGVGSAPEQPPYGGVEPGEPGALAQPGVVGAPDEPGLTYGEAIERQRRERLERERREREQAVEREQAQREGRVDTDDRG
ncbi:MAG TPA: general stress protein [Kineosporiaceae bacterium]